MKKRILILAISLMILCLTFMGCNDTSMIFPDDLKAEIINDHLILSGIQSDKKPEEIEYEFLGKYGDSVAIYFHTSGAYETPIEEEIAGCKFNYPDSRVIRIWNDGKFYKMTEAFEMDLISKSDVQKIYTQFENIEFVEPYFIYESKEYFPYDQVVNQLGWTVVPGIVYVRLDEGISTPNKEIDPRFFVGIDIEKLESRNNPNDNPDDMTEDQLNNYSQRFYIYLKDVNTLEETVEIMHRLEQIDGIVIVELRAYDPNPDNWYDAPPNITE